MTTPEKDIDLEKLQRDLRHPRTLFSFVLSGVTGLMTLIATIPLFSVLLMLVWRGGRRLSIALFTELPPAAKMPGGGIGNALLGTFVIVAIAILISVPFGILAAIFLGEFAPESRTAVVVRFAAKVLTGLPSILAGVFAYVTVVKIAGFSAPAAGMALALLMLPTVLLTADEAIRMVPSRMREAAIGMGATTSQSVLWVILPVAFPGILTGVMLAVARAAGETAPLLFTAVFSDYWISADLMQRTPSLAVLIYEFSGSPYQNQIEIAWAASLVLVLIVLLMNLGGQALSGRMGRK
jgi:phosphate transport system permease protein